MSFEKIHGRFYLTLGGFIGFTLAFFGGLFAGNDSVTALRDGAIGTLVGFFLARSLLKVVMMNVSQVLDRRREEVRAAIAEEARRAEEEADQMAKEEADRLEHAAEERARREEEQERARRKAA